MFPDFFPDIYLGRIVSSRGAAQTLRAGADCRIFTVLWAVGRRAILVLSGSCWLSTCYLAGGAVEGYRGDQARAFLVRGERGRYCLLETFTDVVVNATCTCRPWGR